MVDFLRPVLDEKGADVSTDERNLLSVAFKNLISSKRTAWRTITAIEQNPKYTKFNDSLLAYKKRLEDGLYKDCDTVIQLIKTKVLSKQTGNEEARSFFVKMVGDYYRYIAEAASGDRFEAVK